MPDFLERIAEAEARSRDLENQLSDPDVGKQPGAIEKIGKRLGAPQPLLETGEKYKAAVAELDDMKAMLEDDDPELQELARDDLERLEVLVPSRDGLRVLLTPKDPNDEKNAIFEIRAGTGGDEAALFAADLFRMYTRYAEELGWKIDVLSSSESAQGGFKEVIASISGTDVFSRFKHEKGVHRVQRVRDGGQGRIHTSTVTVAVSPGRGGRRRDQERGSPDRRDAGGRSGRTERQHHGLRRPDHAHPDGPRGPVPGREVAAQEQGEGDDGPPFAFYGGAGRLAAERSSEQRSQVGTGERSEKIRPTTSRSPA